MKRILHLSDLHLGHPEGNQWIDDQKVPLAPRDRRAERDVLRETIASLLDDLGDGLGAIVVSGDLTNRARRDGFDEFAELVELLTRSIEPHKIVVVPGNHDMPLELEEGDPDRYLQFSRVTRDLGLCTPLLDGIDFDDSGALRTEASRHPHAIQDESFLILPINSSNFCWVKGPVPAAVIGMIHSCPNADAILAEIDRLRTYDVPRVSNAQITALRRFLETREDFPAHYPGRVNVAVLHHHLLPLSSREELKTFESLTNLGAVRQLLASIGVHIALHGHKHESALYWDYIPKSDDLSEPPRRILVSAAPGTFGPGLPIARLIEVGRRVGAPDATLKDVVAGRSIGDRFIWKDVGQALLWDGPGRITTDNARTVRGESVSHVYAQVQSLFASIDGGPMQYLVCEVENPEDADDIPLDYPTTRDHLLDREWMMDLVEWWQLPRPQLGNGVEFNHGERIYTRWGNQVSQAAELLSDAAPRERATTRASILLLDPRVEASKPSGDFPSFVSVNFHLVQVGGQWRLDCTGTFRKQEMRYWWPINVAELFRIQNAVAQATNLDGSHPLIGVLRTVTGYAVVQDRLPTVALSAVDRAVDQHPDDLWRMAYGLASPDRVDRAQIMAMWSRYLDDLQPQVGSEARPGVSSRGLQYILEAVDASGTPGAAGAVRALRQLVRQYRAFGSTPPPSIDAMNEILIDEIESLKRELLMVFGTDRTDGELPAQA